MQDRRAFHDGRASQRPREADRWYHQLLKRYYRLLVPEGARVLELGCGLGDLLAATKPSAGLGVDFSPALVDIARQRHPQPELQFHTADALSFKTDQTFDYILISDLVNDVNDVQALFETALRHAHPQTRLVVNFFNNLWRPILAVAENCGWKAPTLPQNWLALDDVRNLLHLAGWENIRHDTQILWPLKTPLWGRLCNRWLSPCLPWGCLAVFAIARPKPKPDPERQYRCTVVIPARNEAGNIEAAVLRTPELGLGTEFLFIEGHSKDNTWDTIQEVIIRHPERNIRALKQHSNGKGGAVREAFQAATGDILFILDADLTMPPEELPKFYEALRSGLADFVNGVRLVYPMEAQSMQFLNMIANKVFGIAFSWLMGQRVKDTLCGTKVLFKSDYEAIARNRKYFGDFDPFGDFDLLFGASKLNLRIVDLPIRYAARTYGSTNIHRWRHGWLLLRMTLFAARRLKFLP